MERVAEFKKYHSLEDKYFDLNDDWVRQGKFLWEMAPRGEEYYDHHLFGYSQPVECEPELLPGDQLLLQLDTHSAPAWEWGDMGKLYFWILDVDLAKNEFRDVQLDIQMG